MFSLFFLLSSSLQGDCIRCLETAQIIKDSIIDGNVPKNIEKQMEKMCSRLTGLALKSCLEFKESPIKAIIEIYNKIPNNKPSTVCIELKQCQKISKNRLKGFVRQPIANGPTFQTETSPTWSISWEEPI